MKSNLDPVDAPVEPDLVVDARRAVPELDERPALPVIEPLELLGQQRPRALRDREQEVAGAVQRARRGAG
jgi:hypothetical protein